MGPTCRSRTLQFLVLFPFKRHTIDSYFDPDKPPAIPKGSQTAPVFPRLKTAAMTRSHQILVYVFVVVGVMALCTIGIVGIFLHSWTSGINHVAKGHKKGIPLSKASDSPVELPENASDIHYAYEIFWQGGAAIARYHYPHDNIKIQAATHLRQDAPWIEVNSTSRPSVPEHQFSSLAWFNPDAIANGYESAIYARNLCLPAIYACQFLLGLASVGERL